MPETYRYYVEHGICPTCHKRPPVAGRSRCLACLELGKNRMRRKRASRAASGMCPSCGKQPPIARGTLCQLCRDNLVARNKATRLDRNARGVCPNCGNPIDVPGFVQCSSCRSQQDKGVLRLYHKRVEEGLCPDCCNPYDKNPFSTRLCTSCWEKSRARRHKAHSKKRYSGLLEAVVERDKMCIICHKPWGQRRRGIVCHHIDGDPTNNTLENLVLLCRNCHQLITSWMACDRKDIILEFLLEHYPPPVHHDICLKS